MLELSRRKFLQMAIGSSLYVSASSILPDSMFASEKKGLKDIREFLTNKSKLSPFVTLQSNLDEYPGMDEKEAKKVGKNTCGSSTIATSYNILEHLYGDPGKTIKIGQVRDVILKNKNNTYFDNGTHAEREFIQYDGRMYFYDLINAFSMFGFKTVPIFGTDYANSTDNTIFATYARAGKLNETIQENVFNKGGFLVACSTAYKGHFLIITDYKPIKTANGSIVDLELFVIDGRGYDGKGIIGRVNTSEYSRYRININGYSVLTTGIICLLGILPNDQAAQLSII